MSKPVVIGRPVNGQFESEPSGWLKTLVWVALPVSLFLAVVLQLTVVNRLPLPGGAPDLVLLLVTAVAVSTNPMTGTLTGFAGGLALDVAPPAAHYAGEYALIFCLAGYFAARIVAAFVAATGERSLGVELAAMASMTAVGEAGKAGLGLLLSDPEITGPAIRHVLPAAVLWDLLLAPFAYFLVAWVAGLTRPVTERAPRPEFVGAARLASVFRLASAGAAPDLKLAGTGAKFPAAQPGRRVPRLRLADLKSNSVVRTAAGDSGLATSAWPGRRTVKLNFAGSASALRSASAGLAAGRRGRTPKLTFSRSGSDFRPSAGAAGSSHAPKLHLAAGAPAITRQRTQKGPGKGWIRALGSGTGRAARSGSASGAVIGVSARTRVPVAGRRSPKSGWLRTDAHRPATVRRATPGKGWLRRSRRPRANWYASGPSTRWVRRSRAKDRWRSRRQSLSDAVLAGARGLLPSGGNGSGGGDRR